jgi:hypothetical protein
MKTVITQFMALLMISTFAFYGCSPRAKYERKLKRELTSGVRCDSLFMGLYLGMSQKDFYTKCWELNTTGLIRQGTNNATVEYITKGELKHSGTMNFYPKFSDGKIYEMPVRFSYSGWAPWNKELSADNLEADVLRWYEKVYGRGFMEVKHPQMGSAFVKIDGNRRISIFKENDLYVWAIFTDMLVKKDSSDSKTDAGNNSNDIIKDLEKLQNK